jgi:hypothetical protein
MASPYPNLRHAQYASALGVIGPRRDDWGRILFAPPSLANPRTIFDPQPFRDLPTVPFARKGRKKS